MQICHRGELTDGHHLTIAGEEVLAGGFSMEAMVDEGLAGGATGFGGMTEKTISLVSNMRLIPGLIPGISHTFISLLARAKS